MLRFALLFFLMLIIDLYTFQALRAVGAYWGESFRKVIFSLFWGLTGISLVYLLLVFTGQTSRWNSTLTTYLQAWVIILYFSKLLVLPFLVVDDLVRGVKGLRAAGANRNDLNLGRSRFLSQLGLILGSIPLVSLSYGMMGNPYRYKVFSRKLALKTLPPSLKKLRIVQISDIHSGSFTFVEPIQRAIDLINQQEADLVFFTGDLVNEQASEMRPYMSMFSQVKAKYGVFSVLGNHDYGDYHQWPDEKEKAANFQELVDIHQALGWTLLRNENRLVQIEGHSIGIIGVENVSTFDRFPSYGDLPKAYAGCETCAIKLLLSHDPSHWNAEVTRQFRDIDLTFSGHTHGMQFGVEIPGFIKWSPIKLMYKQWAGLYQQGEQYLYVNRGLGFIGYPGRVGILPEITTLDLHPA